MGMTKEEAMNKLLQGHELDNECKRLIIEKFQEELGQEPCGDCISRADAIELIKNSCLDLSNLNATHMMIDSIKGLPSVQPTSFPDNATNGDVLQTIFPCDQIYDGYIEDDSVHFIMKSNPACLNCIDKDWWNAPYKEQQ